VCCHLIYPFCFLISRPLQCWGGCMVPKRPPVRKNCARTGCLAFSTIFSHLCCPTSAEDMPPFNRSHMFTTPLKLNIFTLTWL
jgi:hypothetical protein